MDVNVNGRAGGSGLTVGDVIRRYLDVKTVEAKAGVYTANSLKRVRFYLNSFAEMHGPALVAEARRSDLRTWLLSHFNDWTSSHTRRNAIAVVITCFQWAFEDGLIDRVPYVRPRGLFSPPLPRQAMAEDQYRRIMAAARSAPGGGFKGFNKHRGLRTAFRVAVYFLHGTGARTSEMRSAEWPDVDWQAGVLRLTAHKSARRTGEVRLIPLTARVLRLLRYIHRKRGYPAEGRIFLSSRRRPWDKSVFGKHFRAFADMAGVPRSVTAYSLRHGFCAEALRRGIGERQVADCLGQRRTDMIAWYGRSARSDPEYLRNVAAGAVGDRAAVPRARPAAGGGAAAGRAPAPTRGVSAAAFRWLESAGDGWHTLQTIHDGLRAAGVVCSLDHLQRVLGQLRRIGLVEEQGWPLSWRAVPPKEGGGQP